MSTYPPPEAFLSVFNASNFNYYTYNLDLATAESLFLKLTGGILSGLLTANGGLATTSLSASTSKLAAGTAAAPSYSFSGDTNTGIFSNVADTLKITTGGTERVSFTDTAIVNQIGSIPIPSYTFSGHNDIGMYYEPIFGGVSFVIANTIKFGISTLYVTTPVPIQQYGSTVAKPGYTFYEDDDTGFYLESDGVLATATAGVKRMSISSTAATTTVPLRGSAGTAAAPSYSFSGDTNTGMFSDAADTVKFSTGGTERASISTTALTLTLPISIADGTAAAPSLYFTNDPDTGLYLYADGVIGFAVGGAVKLTISANYLTTQSPIGLAAGTAAAPSIGFTGDGNTGIFSGTADTIKFTTGGTERASISTTAITSTLPIINAAGTAAAPSITFTSDTNTGMFSDAADTVKFSTNGTERFSISTTAITSTLPINATGLLYGDGSVSAPSISFTSDTNTGFYRPAADGIGVVCGGSYVGGFSTTIFETSVPFSMAPPVGTTITLNPVGNNNLIISTGTSSVTFTAPDIYKVSTGTNLGYYSKSAASLHRFYRDTSTTTNAVLEIGSDVTSTDATKLQIFANGDVKSTTGVYTTISDARMKENVSVVACDYLEDVNKLQVKRYNLKGDDTQRVGLVVQDMIAADVFTDLVDRPACDLTCDCVDRCECVGCNEAIHLDDQGNRFHSMGIKTSSFMYVLIKALQEASNQIEQLQQRVDVLESLPL